MDRYQAAFPALLEIPSKEHPYGSLTGLVCVDEVLTADPSKDSVLKRVQKLRGD